MVKIWKYECRISGRRANTMNVSLILKLLTSDVMIAERPFCIVLVIGSATPKTINNFA